MYRKNLVFFAACFGMLLFGIVFLSLGSMVNMLAKRFALDDAHIGTLTALLPAGILAGSLIFGPIVDRFGYKWLLILCSLMVLLTLEGIAFAKSIGAVKFYIFLIGFGGGMLNGATNALVADVSEGERGAKLSLLGVFFGIGALGMPGLLAALSKHFATENIVAGIGLFIILPIVYFIVIQFPPPKASAQNSSLIEGFKLLGEPLLLLMALVLGFQSGMEGMSNDWMTRYFTKVLNVDENGSLIALTTLVASMTGTRLLLGTVLKRIRSHWVLFASFAVCGLGALMLRAPLPAPPGTFNNDFTVYPRALLAVANIGIGLSACFPVLLGYIGDLYPTKSGTAFSITFVIALSGNMAINKTMGYVGQNYGTAQFTRVLLACLACALVLLAFVIKKLHKTNPNLIKSHEQPRETMAR